MPVRVLAFAAAVVTVALGCSWFVRTHDQRPGHYTLLLSGVTSDGCGLVSTLPSVDGGQLLGDGNLEVPGDTVDLVLNPYDVDLRGFFVRGVRGKEKFTMNGSGGARDASVSGTDCLVQLLSLSLDGITQSDTTFEGTFQFRYDTHGSDVCTCETDVTYRALLDDTSSSP